MGDQQRIPSAVRFAVVTCGWSHTFLPAGMYHPVVLCADGKGLGGAEGHVFGKVLRRQGLVGQWYSFSSLQIRG